MSQDGQATECAQAWAHGNPFRYCPCGWIEPEPEPHPGGEAFIPRRPVERERLERELRDARLTLAAIVTQHGESLGDGRYRMAVDPAHLETAEARHLSVQLDPVSGAMIIRVRPL